MKPFSRRPGRQDAVLLAVALAFVAFAELGWSTESKPYDILLSGGQLVDGTGARAFFADLVIKNDRIAAIGLPGSFNAQAEQTIDVTGLTVTPGFIDLHAHSSTIDQTPLAENFLRQGITTTVDSLHSQDQPWPLTEYTAALKIAPNIAFFAGHTWIRKQVMGLENRPPTEAELEAMKALVEQSMQQGALGLASGLEYVPAVYAGTDEIIELARVASDNGGIYMSHIRDEGAHILEAFDETVRIGREADIPVHINHHKIAGAAQFGWSTRTLDMMDAARATGVDITHDLYPYDAFSTYSDILFPAWALAGGEQAFADRIADPATRETIEAEMRVIFPQQTGGGFDSIQFRDLPGIAGFAGRTLADLLAARDLPQDLDAAIDLLIELQLAGGFIGIFHSMSEDDIERIMLDEWAMFESDGDLVAPGEGYPHPRCYGAFPRVLARYVRERGTLSLEQAIHKMTAMPAARIGQADRGMLKPGMFADIAIFNPATIQDLATYTDPHHYSTGIDFLFINGIAVISKGEITGALPGQVLTGPAFKIRQLADDVWADTLQQSTEQRLTQGLPISSFEDLSIEQYHRQLEKQAEWRARLADIDVGRISTEDRLTHEILAFQLKDVGADDADYWLRFDVTPYVGGYLFQFPQQALAGFAFDTNEDTGRYLALVEDYARLLGQMLDKVHGQMERGIYLPKPALPATRATWEGLKQVPVGVEEERLAGLSPDEQKAFQQKLDTTIDQLVRPGFEDLLAALGDDYESRAPKNVGLGQYPNGLDVYNRRIRAETTLELKAKEIHQIGLQSTSRILEEMQKIQRQLGYSGTTREFNQQLRQDPRFHASSPEEVEARYQDFIARIEPRLAEYFNTMPAAPYGVKRLPLAAEAGMTFGYYNPPTATIPAGIYYYNGSSLQDRSLLSAGALIYHELLPGHHFQVALQMENTELQPFRRNYWTSAYTEGWAEYAAGVALEMGMYTDPLELYGAYLSQMFLACRLVVDTGMNALGWSMEEARTFMRERVSFSDQEIESELLRYSTSIPAQALAYRLGHEELNRLRALAQARLGDAFNYGDFHDLILLHGSLPLEVLGQQVDRFINASRPLGAASPP